MNVAEWAEQYIRHRDLFEKKMEKLEHHGDHLTVENKDGSKMECFPIEKLNPSVLEHRGNILLVTRNLKENLDFLVQHWKAFASQPVKIVFVNLNVHEKWLIVPQHHDKIADPESLALGLQAMFETVAEG